MSGFDGASVDYVAEECRGSIAWLADQALVHSGESEVIGDIEREGKAALDELLARLAAKDSEIDRLRDTLTAIKEKRCNGCKQPRKEWGPVCPGMTQGDYTHFHSPEWWIARSVVSADPPEEDS